MSESDALTHALRELIRGVIREELAVLRAEPPPVEYRGRNEEAQRLRISVSTLDRLVRDGMPCVHIGDSRRFRAADVDAWLAAESLRRHTDAG